MWYVLLLEVSKQLTMHKLLTSSALHVINDREIIGIVASVKVGNYYKYTAISIINRTSLFLRGFENLCNLN